MTTRDQLRHIPLFVSLPPVEIDVLAVSLESHLYPAGATIFQEGDPGDRLYIVLSGEVEIIKALDTPQERRLGSYGPGAVFGEMGLISHDNERSASTRVSEDAELLVMTRDEFESLLHRYPSMVFDVLNLLVDRLREADNVLIRELQHKNLELSRVNAELEAALDRIRRKDSPGT